jgi:fatty-acyl-CoA synthase
VTNWNYVDVWRAIAKVQGDYPAIVQDDAVLKWADLAQKAEALSSFFRANGLGDESKVALYLYNDPAFMIGVWAAFANRSIPVNVNYRYGSDELTYLFDNADAEALVFHGTFTAMVDEVRQRVSSFKTFVHVDDGSEPCPAWAVPFTEATSHPLVERPAPTPDDLLFLYTGGTTGMPKGVMWRQDDLWVKLNAGSLRRFDENSDADTVAAMIAADGPGPTVLPACPLMHGTGWFTALSGWSAGGTVALLANRHFNPAEMAGLIRDHGVAVLAIVGDPFARPLLRTLDGGGHDISSLIAIVSSGAMFSHDIKEGLLGHHPNMLLIDAFSSSEALGMGSSVSGGGQAAETARFTLGENVRVVDEDGNDVVAGSDTVGRIMLGGRNPLGYYKDPAKSDATFVVRDGVRYSVPGDMASVNADGSIHLLGRGSQCINTAGEKVFPEEVEETLKTHVAVADACVVGVPDEEYGQRIVAAVELHPDQSVDEVDLIGHVKSHLASYKAPRAIRFVPSLGRAVNGKMDYARHQREAVEWVQNRA